MFNKTSRNNLQERGFTLIEVTISIFILSVGLLSAALLATRMMGGSDRSKFMSAASVLASEKLEDLNRWGVNDPPVCVQAGDVSEGSLTTDVLQDTTCPSGHSASTNYYDDVNMSLANGSGACPSSTAGCFAETVSGVAAGATVYTTTYHSPSGILQSTNSGTPPGGNTFKRRWLIEPDTPTVGVRRVTVVVTLSDPSISPPVNFQMSMIRP
jgi:prepilin-type N-terminal cleavage/methylation domain-containing protein